MKTKDFIAKVEMNLHASVSNVWDALVNPEIIKKYMFGTTVVSDWKEGSKIIWKGEWKGKTYEDKGIILKLKPQKLIQYSHYSPLGGLPDVPENYNTVTIALTDKGKDTFLSLTQDNNATEESREQSEKNWEAMLTSLNTLLGEKKIINRV